MAWNVTKDKTLARPDKTQAVAFLWPLTHFPISSVCADLKTFVQLQTALLILFEAQCDLIYSSSASF